MKKENEGWSTGLPDFNIPVDKIKMNIDFDPSRKDVVIVAAGIDFADPRIEAEIVGWNDDKKPRRN